MTHLQAAGVPAAAVSDARALFEDPHLHARGYWQWLQRPVVGLQPNPSAAYREAGRPYRIRTPSPTLGQHNEAVLGGLLGLSAEAMAALEARGIIGTRPRLRGPRRPLGA
jgi:crotonobetainyl-CoA:carnitine CoA-transferase CaiB-like acyl-CoA transferase